MSTLPDINLSMSLFDWFKPLDKVIDIVDKAVPDKDRANEIKAELNLAQISLRGMAEQTYRAELTTQTIPWVDALHKMGRQILSVLNLIFGAAILIYMVHQGQDLTLETALAVMTVAAPSTAYNYVKGKGRA